MREEEEGEVVVEGVEAAGPRSLSQKGKAMGARPSYITFNTILNEPVDSFSCLFFC